MIGPKSSLDPWVRKYDIREAVKHRKGYTIYRVVSKVFPRNSIEAVTEVVVWKRYSDFKKLSKSLMSLHQSLHLKGAFPKFVSARYFGRFDQDVIEERRKCCIELLQFISQCPPLYNSQIFVKFFEGGQEVPVEEDNKITITEILVPDKAQVDDPKLNLNMFQEAELRGSSQSLLVPLSGTWKHHQSAEDISLNSDCSDYLAADDSTNSSLLQSSEISMFDPLASLGCTDSGNVSNAWLLTAIKSCAVDSAMERTTSPDLFNFPEPFANEFSNSVIIRHPVSSPTNSPTVPDVQSTDHIPSSIPFVSLEVPNPSSDFSQALAPPNPSLLLLNKTSEARSEIGYLVEAAQIISSAKGSESEGNYEDSFAMYKEAVGILLAGVQGESDATRREAVRRKIAQYLSHAEMICSQYLKDTLRQDNLRWAAGMTSKNSSPGRKSPAFRDNGEMGLYGAVNELSKLRVLGIVGKLLLVLDLNSNQTKVIKCLQKSSNPSIGLPNIVPQNIPFMVELLKVYETADCLYLVLKHASGGKLWDYVSSYLERSPASPTAPLVPSFQGDDPEGNVYTGRKLTQCQNGDGDDDLPAEDDADVNSVDSDLKAPAECPSSYVQLFTSYAASVQLGENVSLATCSIPKGYIPMEDDIFSDYPPLQYESKDSEPIVEENLADCDNVLEARPSEVESLIEHSKALLQTVDKTLKATVNVAHANEQVRPPDFKVPESEKKLERQTSRERERRPSRKQSTATKTSHNWAASPCSKMLELSRRLSCSMGSLELRAPTQRTRQLSEIFHQLDANRRSATTSSLQRLPESCVRIWAAEIVTALAQLHLMGIIWRDFHPDNILLGDRGHILLTYVCRWNCVDRICDLQVKKNMYAAPEVGGIYPVTPACDWWSLGAVMYELLTGKSVIQSHPTGITSHTRLSLPSHLSLEAKDFLDKLLRYHPQERLGAGSDGIESLRDHPFFAGIDWTKLASNT